MSFFVNQTEKALAGVKTQHPEYLRRLPQWRLIRDCVEGSDAVKAAGEVYLPRAKGTPIARYDAYKKRARFVNYVEQTLMGTHGMIFRRMPVVEYPVELEPIIKNIDREGNDISQFLADSVLDIMQTNWGGYLVDVPYAEKNLTVFEAEQRGIRPYVTYYPAEAVINWKFKVVNGTKVPVLVVLRELVELERFDQFSHDLGYQYRVLMIGDDGYYKQVLYKPEAGKNDKVAYTTTDIPFMYHGKKIDYIPFVFTPGNMPEKPMLRDIAEVNIGHYMMTADYQNGVHLTTIPTGWVTGHKPEVDKEGNLVPILLGGDSFLEFEEENAKVGTLCYAGEGLTHNETALEQAELQMVVLGSRIITPEKGISETAESANIHRAGENAKLATFANNMSQKITKVLNIICSLEGVSGECTVRLNTDYETQGFDANALNAMANIFREGKMPLYVLYSMMMRGEFMDPNVSYEDYCYQLELEASGLTPSEVYEAYKQYKETGVRQDIKINTALIQKNAIDPSEKESDTTGDTENKEPVNAEEKE